jgi:hypothetical protein
MKDYMRIHIFLALVLVSVCIVCGCTSPSAEDNSYYEGITEKTETFWYPKVTFDDAMLALDIFSARGVLDTEGIAIYQVNGVDVDINGDASAWILGIRRNGEISLLIYSAEAWREYEWSEPLPAPEIDLNRTISPGELFEKQRVLIEDAMLEIDVADADLELTDNKYTIAFRSKTESRILSFSADTGELIK